MIFGGAVCEAGSGAVSAARLAAPKPQTPINSPDGEYFWIRQAAASSR